MKLWSAASAITLCLVLLLGCDQGSESSSARTQSRSEITIAAALPLTGDYAEMGTDLLHGIELAVEHVNLAGGVNGLTVRLVVEDDAASPREAVAVAHKIVGSSEIVGLVGHMNSGTMLAASSVYADAGLPVVMPVPTNPEITRQGFRNLFRIPITDDLQGPECARHLVEVIGAARVAVVHNQEAYGEGISSEVRNALGSLGAEVVAYKAVRTSDTDFRPVITRIRDLDPDAVFFGGGAREAALFIKQSRDLSLDVPFVMGDGCFDSQLTRIAGDAVEGSFVSNIAPLTAPTPEAAAFYAEFLSRHQKVVAFAPLGYVATKVLLDGVASSADEPSRGGVLDVLQDPTYEYESILGPFRFGPIGDAVDRQVYMHVVHSGEFVSTAE